MWQLMAKYPDGWEEETQADTREEAEELLEDYRRNAPQYAYKIRRKRVRRGLGTYKVVRFFAGDDIPNRTIKTGLTLEEAQAHCNDPATRVAGEWFDGYEEETAEFVE